MGMSFVLKNNNESMTKKKKLHALVKSCGLFFIVYSILRCSRLFSICGLGYFERDDGQANFLREEYMESRQDPLTKRLFICPYSFRFLLNKRAGVRLPRQSCYLYLMMPHDNSTNG